MFVIPRLSASSRTISKVSQSTTDPRSINVLVAFVTLRHPTVTRSVEGIESLVWSTTPEYGSGRHIGSVNSTRAFSIPRSRTAITAAR